MRLIVHTGEWGGEHSWCVMHEWNHQSDRIHMKCGYWIEDYDACIVQAQENSIHKICEECVMAMESA